MSYTVDDLRDKLLEIYPEITKFGLSIELNFDDEKNA